MFELTKFVGTAFELSVSLLVNTDLCSIIMSVRTTPELSLQRTKNCLTQRILLQENTELIVKLTGSRTNYGMTRISNYFNNLTVDQFNSLLFVSFNTQNRVFHNSSRNSNIHHISFFFSHQSFSNRRVK